MAKKKVFRLYGTVQGSIYLGTIEATSKEEAVELAENDIELTHISFCASCADQCEDPEVTDIVAEED